LNRAVRDIGVSPRLPVLSCFRPIARNQSKKRVDQGSAIPFLSGKPGEHCRFCPPPGQKTGDRLFPLPESRGDPRVRSRRVLYIIAALRLTPHQGIGFSCLSSSCALNCVSPRRFLAHLRPWITCSAGCRVLPDLPVFRDPPDKHVFPAPG